MVPLLKELITDEGRGWLHEDMANFLAELNILHTVAPGDTHTRMGAAERRHQVLRKTVEIYLLPQVNSAPTVAGYLPTMGLGLPP